MEVQDEQESFVLPHSQVSVVIWSLASVRVYHRGFLGAGLKQLIQSHEFSTSSANETENEINCSAMEVSRAVCAAFKLIPRSDSHLYNAARG